MASGKAKCWVVSYAPSDEGDRGVARAPRREGLLCVRADVTTLHRHPDGARLAHGPVTRGMSPGTKLRVGRYACELLMLAPHGGGGNPAYAAAFVAPGETIPAATSDGGSSWLEWFLDEESDEGKFELRAPPLPRPDDPQPMEPIPFEYYPVGAPRYATAHRAYDERAAASYETPRMAVESYERERGHTTGPAVMVNAYTSAPAPKPVSIRQTEVQRPRAEPPASAPAESPRVLRASVFEEEFLDDESFAREVRFDNGAVSTETVNVVLAPSTGGTLDEMDSLRKQLAELERLTGVSADDAERVLNEDLSRNSEVSTEKMVPEIAIASPKGPPNGGATPVKPTVSLAPAPTIVSPPVRESVSVSQNAVVEVPATVSVSSNIFKANDSGVATKPAFAARATISTTETESPSDPPQAATVTPAACAPVVRASPQNGKPLAPVPVPSVVAVTPHEVETNDAWAAAVARRNRSVDESSDEDDLEDVRIPTKIVQNIAKQPNRVHLDGETDVNARQSGVSPSVSRVSVERKVVVSPSASPSVVSPGIASRAAAFEKPHVATSTVEGEYRTGSVAQRASLFGEQASFRKK